MAGKSVGDKMLQAVLMDEKLMVFGGYSPDECTSLVRALSSDNCIVNAVARIIDRGRSGASESEVYREVNEFLKSNI